MSSYLALFGLPFIFLVDYLAIILWLMRTAGKPDQPLRFSVRALLLAMTVAGIHFGIFAAFLSADL